MDDLISRQAAIDALDNIKIARNASWYPYYQQALTAMSKLPSAQPDRRYDEWCNTCKEYDQEKHCCPRWNHVIRTTLQEVRKKGKWIDVNGNGSLYECDQCHDRSCCAGKYCMECGAQMEMGE